MDLTIVEEPISRLDQHAEIPISFLVDRILTLSARDSGLSGISMAEVELASPWVKDYDADDDEGATRWLECFDTSNWGLLTAFDGRDRVGSAVIAFAWEPGNEASDGTISFPGWIWRYDLTPAGPSAAEVTLTYDWSAVPGRIRDHIGFPPSPRIILGCGRALA